MLWIGATVLASALLLSGLAHAEPTRADLDREIRKKSDQLEVIVERYHALHDDLKTTEAQTGVLRRQIDPLQRQIAQRRAAVGRLADAGYRSTRSMSLTLLLDAGSTRQILDRLLLMNEYTLHQQREIEALAQTSQRWDTARRTLDALLAQQREQRRELAAKRTEIENSIAALRTLRQRAYGYGGGHADQRPDRTRVALPRVAKGANEKVVRFALDQIGTGYKWGGEGPGGYDCSGLVAAAFHRIGINLPHHAGRQEQRSREISRSELKAGDLVFFYADLHHVGIYLGDGNMVHAPSFGERVRIDPIDSLPVNSFGRVVAQTG
ncbi:C40 family peptidase [Catellatospora tritici]|uniref:C40 family peptidase n=1 Tax=Catellatospora tritici TaxID=2851566 RepID=UPI001C2DE407|nr:NlpC/P60 family protein [Catellatospora tritici]MBV1849246.1 C40 family peptidase [Catellatospora tritici]